LVQGFVRVVVGGQLPGNFGPVIFLLRDEGGFGMSGRGAFLFVGGFALPFENRFPVLNLLAIELLLSFFRRERAFGTEVALFVTSGAAVALDVVEELTLGVVGDLSPFDRGGRVGAFEAGGKGTGFLMGRAEIAGGVLAGLQLGSFFLSTVISFVAVAFRVGGGVAFGPIVGVEELRDGRLDPSELRWVGARIDGFFQPHHCKFWSSPLSRAARSSPMAGMSKTVVSAGVI
jgi:hypothetical protein